MARFPVTYRCPHCGHGFVRITRKITGSTTCPKCLKGFTRTVGRVLDDEAVKVRREALERKYEKNSAIYAPNPAGIASAVIRGEQIPLSSAEARFKARAIEKGWRPHRPSWPDFLVETESGFIAVEVKARTDELSETQIQTFTLLESFGIPVYIWKDMKTTRSNLIRWSAGKALERVAATRKSKRKGAATHDAATPSSSLKRSVNDMPLSSNVKPQEENLEHRK